MAGSALGNVGVYKYGFSPTGAPTAQGVNREDLLDTITNIDPWDTPWVSQAPKVTAQHVMHQWLKDALSDASTPISTAGAVEGADYAADASTTPTREYNYTMIFRADIGVSETQRAVNSAGFKDAYAYEMQKATKRLAIALERACFEATTTSVGSATTPRQMKNFQDFITTNVSFAGTNGNGIPTSGATNTQVTGGATTGGTLSTGDFSDMLQTIFIAGGTPEQVYVSPKVKRIVSAFVMPGASAAAPGNRNIAVMEKKIVSSVDFYDSDFGLIQIVLDRWIPEGTATATAAGTGNNTAAHAQGQMFFLQRNMNRLAWLRPMAHQLVGKRGDSVAGLIVGEVTMEVLNEKANGRIKSVNSKSYV